MARDIFSCEWTPSEQDNRLYELAKRYHEEAEAYDRTVCTGPVMHGSVMPFDHRELALVNGYAWRLRKQIMTEAAAHGINAQDMARAIGRHA